MFVVDLRHFLDENGDLAAMPAPAVTLARFNASIVGWVTRLPPGSGAERTNVPCRAQSRGKRCRGEIDALLSEDEVILWHCSHCAQEGVISGWQETRWDRRVESGDGGAQAADPVPVVVKKPRAGASRLDVAEGAEGEHFAFEVSLLDVEPRIWRRFLIKSSGTFLDLHAAIQDACGWQDYHLFEFQDGETGGRIAGTEDHDAEEPCPNAAGVKLTDFFGERRRKSCLYIYDFGDSWTHDVTLVETLRTGEKFRRRLIAGERAFPKEDSGGVPGYERCVAVVETGKDPEGEDPDEFLKWIGTWRPDDFNLASAKKRFDRAK
jgi:Plasmid pRiA4b ORF-3-like protein